MKRLFILLLCLFCLFLSSCGERDYGFLPFENKNVKAECEVNGKFTVIIDKTQNECSLTVVSPSEISGLKFTFSEDGDFIIADGMTSMRVTSGPSGILSREIHSKKAYAPISVTLSGIERLIKLSQP